MAACKPTSPLALLVLDDLRQQRKLEILAAGYSSTLSSCLGCPYCRECYPRFGATHVLPGGHEEDCHVPPAIDHTGGERT